MKKELTNTSVTSLVYKTFVFLKLSKICVYSPHFKRQVSKKWLASMKIQQLHIHFLETRWVSLMSCDLSCCGFENRSVKSNCPWFCLSSIICPISLTLISPEHTAWPLLCELRDKIWHSSEQISIPRLRDWTSPNMQPTPKK